MVVEEQILKQRSKVHWLNCGDGNNIYLHASLQSRQRSGIHVLTNIQSVQLTEEAAIQDEVLAFHKCLLGSAAIVTKDVDLNVVTSHYSHSYSQALLSGASIC